MMRKRRRDENTRRKHVQFLSSEDRERGEKGNWDQLEIVGNVRIFPEGVCHMHHLRYLYMAHNQIMQLPAAIGQLRQLMHLDLSYNRLRCLPNELGECTELHELHLHGNQIRQLPFSLGRLFQLETLSLGNNPLVPEYALMYQDHGTQRLLQWLLDNEGFAFSQPSAREWRPLRDPHPSSDAIPFTLMCYNVLCDKYATKQVYPYCPSWALNWDYRRRGIIEEIKTYQGDIVCLQEVETEQFNTFFQPELAKENYLGIFSPKSRAKTMADSEKKHVDGCAIFWKKDRFTLVIEDVIEFSKMAVERYEKDCRESLEMINRVMTRDNIALAAIFETRDDLGRPHQLVVSTAHIHWDPEFSDVKLIQSIMLVSSLWRRIEEHQAATAVLRGQPVTAMPLIICGDFNSLPDSGVVEYLLRGKVNKGHPDFKALGYEGVLDKLSPHQRRTADMSDDVLVHDFNLSRAYENDLGMKYTNYTYEFKGTIDYIFYTKNHFNCIGCLDSIPEEWFDNEKVLGCPHPHVASDHFPLLVELELKTNCTAGASSAAAATAGGDMSSDK